MCRLCTPGPASKTAGIIRRAKCIDHVECKPSIVSLSSSPSRIETTSAALVCSPITVMQCVLSRSAEAGNVVGVQMRVHRLDQPEIQPLRVGDCVRPFHDGVDDQ